MRVYKNLFNKIIDPENLFLAWDEFKRGKRHKLDVMNFEKNLEQNIFELHRDLKNKTYAHRGYTDFYIHDPKRRHIHKRLFETEFCIMQSFASLIAPLSQHSFRDPFLAELVKEPIREFLLLKK